MLVPAPPLFSTTTCWPHILESFSASMRATISVGPPAATGTMTRTGLFGKSPFWVGARAARVKRSGASAGAAQRAIKRRRVSISVPPWSRYYTLSLNRGLRYSAKGRARWTRSSADPIGQRSQLDRRPRATRLLVDERRTCRADHLILRPGAPRTTDGADDLAAFDQRDAAPRRNDVIQAQDVFEIELLHHVLEDLGRTAVLGRGARLVLGDWDRGELRIVHSQEGDKIGARVDDRDVHRPASLAGLRGGGLDHRVGALRSDRRSIGGAERHLFRNGVEIGRGGLLGAQLGTDQHCRTDKQCRQNLPSHG